MIVSHYTMKYSKERLSHCILSTCMIVIQYYIQSLLLHGFIFFFQQKGESTVSHCSLYFLLYSGFSFSISYNMTRLSLMYRKNVMQIKYSHFPHFIILSRLGRKLNPIVCHIQHTKQILPLKVKLPILIVQLHMPFRRWPNEHTVQYNQISMDINHTDRDRELFENRKKGCEYLA